MSDSEEELSAESYFVPASERLQRLKAVFKRPLCCEDEKVIMKFLPEECAKSDFYLCVGREGWVIEPEDSVSVEKSALSLEFKRILRRSPLVYEDEETFTIPWSYYWKRYEPISVKF